MKPRLFVWIPFALTSALGFSTASCANRMVIMINPQGKPLTAPRKGDVLTWNTDITWQPSPGASFHSPCVEDTLQTKIGNKCTVKFKAKVADYAYHYTCIGCGDPVLPGPHTDPYRPPLHTSGPVSPGSAGGGVHYAEAASTTGGGGSMTSAVFNYDTYTLDPISVATYSGGNKNDLIVWQAPLMGDTPVNWSVNIKSANTCSETGPFSNAGMNTCTVQSGAVSQWYCVQYDTLSWGLAGLIVNNIALPASKPSCP
jgi:hypothetical protein